MIKLTAIAMFTGLIITASASAMAGDGASTYKFVCSGCHETGIDGTPKLKDKLEWTHRINQGMNALYASVQNGKCDVLKDLRKDLSDETIKSAVDYMVYQVKQPSPFD